MSRLFKLSIYFLSYIPLWCSVVFIDVLSILENDENLCTEFLGIFLIVIITLISGLIVQHEMSDLSDASRDIYTIKKATEKKTVTADFLLSYILPLFAFDFTRWDGVFLFGIFFLTIGYLCVSHNYFCVNIVLEMKKYHFYECTVLNSDEIERAITIISKEDLTSCEGKDIRMKVLNNEYRLLDKVLS